MIHSELNDFQLKLYYFEYLLMIQLAFPGSLRTIIGGKGAPPDADRIACDFNFETLRIAQMFIHFTRRTMKNPRFDNAEGPRVIADPHGFVLRPYYCRVRCLIDSQTVAGWFRRMQEDISVRAYPGSYDHAYLEACQKDLQREGHKNTAALAVHHKNGTTPIGEYGV